MAKETFNRIQLKFLSTNVDRDLREEYDSESETYFVSKVHIPNPYIWFSILDIPIPKWFPICISAQKYFQ